MKIPVRTTTDSGGVIDDWKNFPARFGGVLSGLLIRVGWTDLYQIWRDHRSIVGTHQVCFRYPILCCSRNQSALIRLRSKIEAKFRTFWPPRKISGGVFDEAFRTPLHSFLRGSKSAKFRLDFRPHSLLERSGFDCSKISDIDNFYGCSELSSGCALEFSNTTTTSYKTKTKTYTFCWSETGLVVRLYHWLQATKINLTEMARSTVNVRCHQNLTILISPLSTTYCVHVTCCVLALLRLDCGVSYSVTINLNHVVDSLCDKDDITFECSPQAAPQAMPLGPRDALSLSQLHRATSSPRPAQPGTSLWSAMSLYPTWPSTSPTHQQVCDFVPPKSEPMAQTQYSQRCSEYQKH